MQSIIDVKIHCATCRVQIYQLASGELALNKAHPILGLFRSRAGASFGARSAVPVVRHGSGEFYGVV